MHTCCRSTWQSAASRSARPIEQGRFYIIGRSPGPNWRHCSRSSPSVLSLWKPARRAIFWGRFAGAEGHEVRLWPTRTSTCLPVSGRSQASSSNISIPCLKIDELSLRLREAMAVSIELRRLCTVPGVGPVRHPPHQFRSLKASTVTARNWGRMAAVTCCASTCGETEERKARAAPARVVSAHPRKVEVGRASGWFNLQKKGYISVYFMGAFSHRDIRVANF